MPTISQPRYTETLKKEKTSERRKANHPGLFKRVGIVSLNSQEAVIKEGRRRDKTD